MDFIARAGAMLDKSHRISGILFVLIILALVLILNLFATNNKQSREIAEMRATLPVYVVPGSLAGTYSPSQDDMLLDGFITLITQSLNTYTYENLPLQYQEVKQFFGPQLLTVVDKYFADKIKIANIDRRSALFVPERNTIKVEDIRDSRGQRTGDKRVVIDGLLNHILAGSTVEAIPLRITMRMNKVIVSRTNPFGYVLESYREEEIK
jgi:hypothetical protein